MTLLLTHTACLDHVTPPGHPERPDRLRAVAEVLGEERFKPLTRSEAPGRQSGFRHAVPWRALRRRTPAYRPAERDDLYRRRHLDVAGHLGSGLRGVGGAVAATDAVMSGTHQNAFVAVRPPGHHAEPARADGLLPLQQRRHRGPSRAAQVRHRPRRDRRFRRPSRQRHAGHLLARSDRACTSRPIRCRCIPAPAPAASAASTTPSSTCRWLPRTAAPSSAQRSKT